MSYYKPPTDALRRLLELRTFDAVVSQIQRDAERTTLEIPTEEQIATQIIEEVPLIDVTEATFNRIMVDLYASNGRDITKDICGLGSMWVMKGQDIARSDRVSFQIRPSLLDADLNRYDTIKE